MKQVAFRDVGTFINGYSFGPEEWSDSGYPIIRIQNLNDPSKPFNYCDPQKVSPKYIVNKGDLLISWSASLGVFQWDREPGLVNQHIFKVVLDESRVDKNFFAFVVQSTLGELSRNTHGSTMKHITRDRFLDTKFILPSMDQQRLIAAKLQKAKDCVALRSLTISELDRYLRSLFLEMFGDPSSNPKKWAMEELGKHIDILTDYHANGSYETLRKHVELLSEKDYALMVRTTDLEHNEFEKDVNYITEEAYNFLEKSKVFGGEIIINKIGSAGNVYLMPHLNRPVSLGMNAFLLRFKKTLNSSFVYHLLTSEYGKSIIKVHVKGAVTKTITKDAIRSLLVPIAPIELQEKFLMKADEINTLKMQFQKSESDLNFLFSSLMSEAFQ